MFVEIRAGYIFAVQDHNIFPPFNGMVYMTSQGERVLRDMGFQYSKTNI